MFRSLDFLIAVSLLVWVFVLLLSLSILSVKLDPSLNLVLMGVVGTMVLYRRPHNSERSS